MSELLAPERGDVRRRVLVGLAPERRSRAVLRAALQLCRPGAASELHVAHAVDVEPRLRERRYVRELAALLHASMAELRAFVEARARGARGPERVFHVRVGSPLEVLDQLAGEIGADLIVVGGRAPYPAGSLAEVLMRSAAAPLLIARLGK